MAGTTTRILAIEASTRVGSLAAGESSPDGFRLLLSEDLPSDARSAQTLAPALADVLGRLGWPAETLDAVATTTGQGSFTGLRIGVTAAKTLAYAAGARAIGVNTLSVVARQWLAYPQCDHAPRTHVVMDAHRNEFFAAVFEYPPTGDQAAPEVALLGRGDWLDQLDANDAVGGSGLAFVTDQLPDDVLVAPEEHWRPRAETVARLAAEALGAGRCVKPYELLPDYYRLSAAEEKAAEQA